MSEALYLALVATLDPGDEVIVPTPCFVAYQPEVLLAGGTPVPLPTTVEDAFQVAASAVEALITPRTKALLIGYPNNPTGAVMSRERLVELARVAEAHDLLVISDEIYDRLVYGGHQHVCFAGLPGMRERTITLGGFSKAYAMTGWRIGYAAAPAPMLSEMRKVHQYTIMSAPTTAQIAALEAIRSGEPHVQAMVEEYDRRRRLIVGGLERPRPSDLRAQGRFLCVPVDRRHRDDRRGVRRSASQRGTCGGRPGQRLRRGRKLRPLFLCHGLREDRTGPGAHSAVHAPTRVSAWGSSRPREAPDPRPCARPGLAPIVPG